MNRVYNTLFFVLGLILFLFGLLIAILLVDIAIEGFESEEAKIGAAVISFLMTPITVCGIYLTVTHRPRRPRKRIKIKKIIKVIQKKDYHLTKMDLVSNMNLKTDEAALVLKELAKIGLGKLRKDRYGRIEFIIDSSASFNVKRDKAALMNGIRSFMISTGFLRIFVCVILITISIVALLLGMDDSCSDGFYYVIFFSFASGLSSTYIIWWHNNNAKKKFPSFIEVKGR